MLPLYICIGAAITFVGMYFVACWKEVRFAEIAAERESGSTRAVADAIVKHAINAKSAAPTTPDPIPAKFPGVDAFGDNPPPPPRTEFGKKPRIVHPASDGPNGGDAA